MLYLLLTEFNCGEYFNGTEGIFTSPNYPSDYPNSFSCNWQIEAPEGSRIAFNFTDFDLQAQYHNSCMSDYLAVSNVYACSVTYIDLHNINCDCK